MILVEVPVIPNQSEILQRKLFTLFFNGVRSGGPANFAICARLSAPGRSEQDEGGGSRRSEHARVTFETFVALLPSTNVTDSSDFMVSSTTCV